LLSAWFARARRGLFNRNFMTAEADFAAFLRGGT